MGHLLLGLSRYGSMLYGYSSQFRTKIYIGRNLLPLSSSFLVKGVLDSAGFPAVVTAHFVHMEGQQRPRTTILIKFAEEVSSW